MKESERSSIDMGEFFSPENLKIHFAQLLKETPDLVEKIKLTQAFLQLIAFINPDDVEGVMGIKIVEKNEGDIVGKDCYTYFVRDGTGIQQFHDEMFATHAILKEPVPGTYALYLRDDKKEGLKATHIGKVTDDLTIISKWGINGHVFEHLPEWVPVSYGSHIAYFSSKKN